MRRLAYFAAVVSATLLLNSVLAIQSTPSENEVVLRVEYVRLPYEVKYAFDSQLPSGELLKVEHGVEGRIVREFQQVVRDGTVIAEKLIRETVTDPAPAIFKMGRPSNRGVSGGTYTRAKVVEMESTAYTPDAGRRHPTFITYTGTKAEYGAIAVDPRVIPFGTLMYVEGYGFGIAEDTGSAIKGNIIDVCIEGRKEALRWGRRQVKVHIFEDVIELPSSETSSAGTE